jgi:hypothetical protein
LIIIQSRTKKTSLEITGAEGVFFFGVFYLVFHFSFNTWEPKLKKRKVLVPKGRRFDVFYLVPGFSKGLLVFDLPRHPPGRKRKKFHP